MRSTRQTLLYIIVVALIVAVSHQVERICFLVSPGSRWWKCCLMKAASFLLWMKVVLRCCCLAFPSFWNAVHALGSMQEVDCDCPKWNHDRKINVLLISIEYIMSTTSSEILWSSSSAHITWEGKILYLCCCELPKASDKFSTTLVWTFQIRGLYVFLLQ